jgi:hypothetical protein
MACIVRYLLIDRYRLSGGFQDKTDVCAATATDRYSPNNRVQTSSALPDLIQRGSFLAVSIGNKCSKTITQLLTQFHFGLH